MIKVKEIKFKKKEKKKIYSLEKGKEMIKRYYYLARWRRISNNKNELMAFLEGNYEANPVGLAQQSKSPKFSTPCGESPA